MDDGNVVIIQPEDIIPLAEKLQWRVASLKVFLIICRSVNQREQIENTTILFI